MGEPNNALAVYMNRPDRIRDLLEYYLGEKLPAGWSCKEIRGLYAVRNAKGKLSYCQRDFLADVCLWGVPFRLGLENHDSVNLTFPWRLMELDCLAYGKEIEEIQERNQAANKPYRVEDDFKYHYRRADRILPVEPGIFYKDTKECGGCDRRMYEYQGYQRQPGFYSESGDRREGGRYVQGIDRFEEGCGETRYKAGYRAGNLPNQQVNRIIIVRWPSG